MASPVLLNGRITHVEGRRPNSGASRGGRTRKTQPINKAILLNGSISNTDGSLILRLMSMRWQLLVVCTS
ncbi:hypothetical protein KFK09_000558 [Dendrobium nobile]|uniref:Uncharacterized protein n=1 Tax=Dendrobium nobile TaxID=94219 RepID=A0A8T3CEA5_DENNO|nr:hypothetical protein KFK09_000558 [Dendrobium nobile]